MFANEIPTGVPCALSLPSSFQGRCCAWIWYDLVSTTPRRLVWELSPTRAVCHLEALFKCVICGGPSKSEKKKKSHRCDKKECSQGRTSLRKWVHCWLRVMPSIAEHASNAFRSDQRCRSPGLLGEPFQADTPSTARCQTSKIVTLQTSTRPAIPTNRGQPDAVSARNQNQCRVSRRTVDDSSHAAVRQESMKKRGVLQRL